MKPLKFIITLIVILCFQSCTEPVDFDQIDDAEIKPNYIVTQVFFDLKAADFLDDSGNEIYFKGDLIQSPLGEDAEGYLEKIEFTFVTENSFDREFDIQIMFFGDSTIPIYTLQSVNIPPSSESQTAKVEIPSEDIHFVFDARYFGYTIIMHPNDDGTQLLPNNTSELNFKSYLKLFVKYTTE